MGQVNINTSAVANLEAQIAQNILAEGALKDTVVSKGPGSQNAFYLVAAMMADYYQVLKSAQPSAASAENAAIDNAISQSVQASSPTYNSLVSFWKSLQASLPADSPLMKLATSQVNLLTNDPELIADLQKVQKDQTNVQNDQNRLAYANKEIAFFKDKWYNWLDPANGAILAGWEIGKGIDELRLASAQGQLAGDSAIVDTREQELASMSGTSCSQNSISNNAVLSSTQEANSQCNAELDQMVEMSKAFQTMELQS